VARARNIKPSLFKNEILGEADPLLTILFQGLWCLADREGRLEDRPKRIKAEVFPYREIDAPLFNRYLTELAQLGFIDRYEVGGQAIIQVINFEKHQSPHKTEKPSELPENPNPSISCPITVKAPLDNETVTVKESLIPDSLSSDSLKEQAAQKRAPPKTRLTIETLPDDWLLYCKTKRPDLDPQTTFESFSDYHIGRGNLMADWKRTWQRWVREEKTNATHHRQPKESISDSNARAAKAYYDRAAGGGDGPPMGSDGQYVHA